MTREDAEKLYMDNEKLVFLVLHRKYPTFVFNEDVQQEARIGLWNACLGYDPERSAFSTYACRAIENSIKIYFRKGAGQDKNPTISMNEAVHGQDHDCAIEDFLVGEEDVDFVDTDALFARLDERDQTILRMLIRGMKQKEIAEELGMTRTNVCMRIAHIRRHAYKELEEHT